MKGINMNSRTNWRVVIAAIGLIALTVLPAQGAIIINDTFTRSGALNGTAASPTDVPGGTWSVFSASGSITTNGSVANLSGGVDGVTSAILPFNLSNDAPANALVTLSADVTVTDTSSGYFIVLGFTLGSGNFFADGQPWMLLTAGGASAGFAGPGTSNQVSSTPGSNTLSSAGNLAITYNKSNNTAEFFLNGTSQGSYTYGTAPLIADVIVELYGNSGNTGTVDNLLVTATTPEPSMLGLLGLCAMPLVRRRRAPVGR